MLPRIALTPGEPAGIGPDLALLCAQKPLPARVVAFADPELLRQRAKILGLPVQIIEQDPFTPPQPHRPGRLLTIPVPLATTARAGQLSVDNAAYVLATLKQAVLSCQNGNFDALVTGPVHKGVINEAGTPFSGHTEYIASFTGGYPVMLLATPGLRVALVTTHLPLAKVASAITSERLESVLITLHRDLIGRFRIPEPRILVCGLNPHAGENGHLGREEIEIIEPALAHLRQQGMTLEGPLPADTVFTAHQLDGADAVLAMYHDQGLPVLKHKGFGHSVNITLGLPIIRTSVDHGTALDLAGTGRAETGSLETAFAAAIGLAQSASTIKARP